MKNQKFYINFIYFVAIVLLLRTTHNYIKINI